VSLALCWAAARVVQHSCSRKQLRQRERTAIIIIMIIIITTVWPVVDSGRLLLGWPDPFVSAPADCVCPPVRHSTLRVTDVFRVSQSAQSLGSKHSRSPLEDCCWRRLFGPAACTEVGRPLSGAQLARRATSGGKQSHLCASVFELSPKPSEQHLGGCKAGQSLERIELRSLSQSPLASLWRLDCGDDTPSCRLAARSSHCRSSD